MIRSLLPALLIFGASLQSGLAQTPPPQETPPTASTVPNRAEMLSDYEPWCGKSLGLSPCVDEIIRVDREILLREKRAFATGLGYNAGNSLVGCRIYCIVRHFPHDTADECKASVSTFEKQAARKPYLWRTDLRQLLLEKCRVPF
jgi:hypothetical protein